MRLIKKYKLGDALQSPDKVMITSARKQNPTSVTYSLSVSFEQKYCAGEPRYNCLGAIEIQNTITKYKSKTLVFENLITCEKTVLTLVSHFSHQLYFFHCSVAMGRVTLISLNIYKVREALINQAVWDSIQFIKTKIQNN